MKVQTVLSDNGREYCGQPDKHPLRAHPVARGHRTPHHHGRQAPVGIKGRTDWYETVAEMQKDLDAYLETYNTHGPPPRPRDGGQDALRGLQGRNPGQITGPEEAGQKGGQDAA